MIANHKQFDCWQQHCEEYLQLLSKQPFDSAMLNPVNQTPKLKLEQSVLVDDIDVRCYLLTAVRKMCV